MNDRIYYLFTEDIIGGYLGNSRKLVLTVALTFTMMSGGDPDVNLKHLVIDAGAIINGQGYSYFNRSEKFWTVVEVLNEIRDGKSRALLASLPFEIQVRAPSDTAMKAVIEFSRKTGDLSQLSMNDLKIIALTYDLEVETNGLGAIRSEPAVKHEITIVTCNLCFF